MRQRIITGVLLALFALTWLFILPAPAFQLTAIIVVIIGMSEWLYIHGIYQQLHLRTYAGLLLSIFLQVSFPWLVNITVIASVLFYLYSWRQIRRFERHQLAVKQDRLCFHTIISGVLVLSTLASILIVWRYRPATDTNLLSSWQVILLTSSIIITSDVGAYFTGKFIGRSPLCPQTSPNKTWEGMISGLLFSLLVGICLGKLFRPEISTLFYAMSALLIASFSIIGDLRISLSKRLFGIKDSGTLFPGHGGVLDRLDGWLAGFPVAYLFF